MFPLCGQMILSGYNSPDKIYTRDLTIQSIRHITSNTMYKRLHGVTKLDAFFDNKKNMEMSSIHVEHMVIFLY